MDEKEQAKHNKEKSKRDLCLKIEQIVGKIPDGLGDILSILVHPNVIDLTEDYVWRVRFDDIING